MAGYLLIKALAFLLGLSSLYLVQSVAHLGYWLLLGGILVFTGIALRKLSKVAVLMSLLGLGISWASISIYFWSLSNNSLVAQVQKTELTGYVCGIPSSFGNNQRFDFCLTNINEQSVGLFSSNKVRLNWYSYSGKPLPVVNAGEAWMFNVKLKPIHGKANPGSIDSEKWMVSNDYVGSGSIKNGKEIALDDKFFQRHYHKARQSIFDALSSVSTGFDNPGFVQAILLGEKQNIAPEQLEAFQNTGTSHLLAISGLHVGIAALWSYWIVSGLWRLSNRLCLRVPAQTAGQYGAIIGAIGLLLVSGMGLPAQRACTMLVLFIMSKRMFRHYSLKRVLGFTIILLGLINPLAILSVSFWLSFFAILVISMVISRKFLVSSKISAWFSVNWHLFLMMLPITLLFFSYYSVGSLIANLLLIPLVSFAITPLAYLGSITLGLSVEFGQLLLSGVDMLVTLMFKLQTLIGAADWLVIQSAPSTLVVILIFLATGFWLVPKKLVHPMFAVSLTFLSLMVWLQKEEQDDFRMVVFDIGQGLAIYVETKEGNLLYDTGWGNADFQHASSIILPFFRGRNIKTLDKLIISHGDNDHSGGVSAILEHISVRAVVYGEPTEYARTKTEVTSESCHSHPHWVWGETHFNFIRFESVRSTTGNNSSCVLSITHKEDKILLTGDIEKRVEKELVERRIAHHDILIAPHHGSKTSSTQSFIEQIQPNDVIFSTGYANQWGFPRTEVVERYKQIGSRIWITHKDGALLVLEGDDRLKVNSWRDISPHFWSEVSN